MPTDLEKLGIKKKNKEDVLNEIFGQKVPEVGGEGADIDLETPAVIPKLESMPDASSLAGRLAAFGVDPNLVNKENLDLANQIKGIYAGQNQANLAKQQQLLEQEIIQKRLNAALAAEQQVPPIERTAIENPVQPEGKSIGGFLKTAITPGGMTKRLAEQGIQTQEGTIALGAVGGAAIAGGLLTKGAALGIGWKTLFKNLAGGGIFGAVVIGRQLSTSQNILAESLRLMADINKAVENGHMTYNQALDAYAEKEQEINNAQGSIHWILKDRTLAWLAGGKDTELKFKNAVDISIPNLREDLKNARIKYLTSVSQNIIRQ